MSEYRISEILPTDRRGMDQVNSLLEKEGIRKDKNLDYTVGLYDENYRLAATGSCFGNTLRCMAVDSDFQGEGLLGQLISHLTEYQYGRGNFHLFLYTKCSKAMFFKDLGFYEIARSDGEAVFMENKKSGFADYLKRLVQETDESGAVPSRSGLPVGAVVMNANPFTLGHQYLLEKAAAACSLLHLFVVSEDASLVPFQVRFQLVKQGISHLSNVVLHKTGSYLISNATFPSYFLKDEDSAICSHARLDVRLFQSIAKALSVSVRFVGEEPFSQVTGLYNQVMISEAKAGGGPSVTVIPRLEQEGHTVSASLVRSLIHDGCLEEIRSLVPETTYRYFTSEEAAPVIQAIQNSAQVIHY